MTDTGNIGTAAQRSAALDLLMAQGLDYATAAHILARAIREAQRAAAERALVAVS